MFSGYPDQNSYGGDDYVSPHPAVINYSFATGSCSTGPPTTYTDEEEVVKLASSNPKKPAGRKKFLETRHQWRTQDLGSAAARHPIYRGVRQRSSGKWVCETREPNKKTRIWLGTLPTLEMAARAHDVAAIALRGRSACLNFADSAWTLPIPASNHPKDIQKAAAEAAEFFRPKENIGGDAVNVEVAVAADEGPFVDEEYDVFGMPGLLANMAEGMLLPPTQQLGDDLEDGGDVPLWTDMMESPRQLTNPPNNNYSAREGYVSSSAAIVPLISTLIALYQMKHQTAKLSPFEAHNMVIVAFVISVFIYTMALAGEIRLQTQAQYLAYRYILGKISFFSGFLASILLVIDLLPVIGWVLLTLWSIFFLRAVSSSCTELFYPTLLKLCLILYSKFRQLPPQRLPV